MDSVNKIDVHFYWVGGKLSELEKLSIASYLHHNFRVNLWVYRKTIGEPCGIIVRDASEILPEDELFYYDNGSPAAAADLFRYRLLYKYGGLWSDTDVVCLRPCENLFDENFLVSEWQKPERFRFRRRQQSVLNNNLIYCARPGDDMMRILEAVADAFPKDKLRWGAAGPRLLDTLAKMYKWLSPKIQPPQFANPISYWNCPEAFIDGDEKFDDSTYFVHLYNEMWRRKNIDKNGQFSPDSTIGRLLENYSGEMNEVGRILSQLDL